MHTHPRIALATALAAITAALVLARPQPAAPPAPAQPAPLADSPVARMIGHWTGAGWSTGRDGQRREARVEERVRWNLAGTALIVEGYGYSIDDATGARTTTHDAIGVIERDPATGALAFYARRAGAPFARLELKINEDGSLQWSPEPVPNAPMIRFVATITDDHWHEVGEMSRDGGATWTPFLGTDLERTTPAGAK